MKSKRLTVLLLAAVLALSSCGTVQGKDSTEGVDSYNANASSEHIMPLITTQTRIDMAMHNFMDRLLSGDYASTFGQLIIDDKTFVTQDNFAQWVQKLGISGPYTVTEQVNYLTVAINSNSGNIYLNFIPERQADGSYLYRFSDFMSENFNITIPSGMKVALDGIELDSKYFVETRGNVDVYTIPHIADASHKITITASLLAQPREFEVSTTMLDFDASNAITLGAEEYAAARKTYMELAVTVLKDMNDIIINQDVNAFLRYFKPGTDPNQLQSAFDQGKKSKSNVYDFHFEDWRELSLSDADVYFITDNLVSITYGTAWTWADKNDIKEDKNTGELIIKKWQTMRMRNNMLIYYDLATATPYVYSMDMESIYRLTAGLNEWQ